MNNFTPNKLKSASKYLEEKLLETKKLCRQKNEYRPQQNVYKLKEQKSSTFERFMHMVFKS